MQLISETLHQRAVLVVYYPHYARSRLRGGPIFCEEPHRQNKTGLHRQNKTGEIEEAFEEPHPKISFMVSELSFNLSNSIESDRPFDADIQHIRFYRSPSSCKPFSPHPEISFMVGELSFYFFQFD